MGEVYMGKLILTARGLNSETGQKIIRKCLTEEEEREKKTIPSNLPPDLNHGIE